MKMKIGSLFIVITAVVIGVSALLAWHFLGAEKRTHAKLAIVIDDCGYDTQNLPQITALKQKITFAVIPHCASSSDALNMIKAAQKEGILHLPMQPLDQSKQSEKITITTDLTAQQITDITNQALSALPAVIGISNHQGSAATADLRVMENVLAVAKQNNLFFFDSNTQPKTIAYKTAKEMGIKTALNQAFLDDQADVAYIQEELMKAARQALQNGTYIVIGHDRPHTAIALSQTIDDIEKMGVEMVFVSELLE
ncbi:MAG: divergent polysaccharide deacetylase family protein [Victivallaceae bacterium]